MLYDDIYFDEVIEAFQYDGSEASGKVISEKLGVVFEYNDFGDFVRFPTETIKQVIFKNDYVSVQLGELGQLQNQPMILVYQDTEFECRYKPLYRGTRLANPYVSINY